MGRKNIGLLIQHTTGGGGFHDAIFRAIVECFAKKPGLNLFILNGGHLDTTDPDYTGTTSYGDTHNKLYKLVNTHFLDGLVIMYTISIYISTAEFRTFCSNFGQIPMITVLGTIPGIPSVCLNNSNGLRKLLCYLCDKLHYKKMAFVKGVDGNPDAMERFGIFNTVMLEKGFIKKPYASHEQHPLLFQGDFSEECGQDAADHFLPLILRKEIDVIVAANDGMAKGIIRGLRNRGIVVPGDVAVTGFDNTRSALAVVPSITTVEQPFNALISHAVEWLNTRLQDIAGKPGEAAAPVYMLEPRIILRQSCGSLSLVYPPLVDTDAAPDPGTGTLLPAGDVEILEQAFLDVLANNNDDNFYKQIRQLMLRDHVLDNDIAPWNQRIIKLLFFLKKKYNAPDHTAEKILTNTFHLYYQILQEIFSDQTMQKEDTEIFFLDTLANIGASFDIQQLNNVVINNFHQLNINSVFIYLYTKTGKNADLYKLHFAYKDKTVIDITKAEHQNLKTINLDLLPADRPWRYSVHSLHYDWEALGFVLIEIDANNADGKIYSNLREVFSTALRGYVLMQQEIKALYTIRNIHNKLLPEIACSKFGEYTVSAVSVPLTTGGGDLFHVYYQHNKLKLAMGDVSGHGVQAGIVMMLSLLNYQLMMKEEQATNSRVFLEKLNNRLYDIIAHNLALNEFASFIVFQQTGMHEFEYAGQHNPPLLYSARSKCCTSLEVSGIWLGLVDDENFKNKVKNSTLRMEHGDILILYTDGITETANRDGDLFGEEGIKRVVEQYMAKNPGAKPDLKALRDTIISSVHRWGEPDDDMTLLIVCHL